ncbi:MAG: hypothetical protein PHN80_13695 [Hespellia sp.]|nr:hypothetical protein [Hespellia sp.]
MEISKIQIFFQRSMAVLIYIGILVSVILLTKKLAIFLLFSKNGTLDGVSISIFACAYILSFLVHELSHALSFYVFGFKIRIISILGVIILISNGAINIKIHARKYGQGGWVLPQISYNIDSENDYHKFKRGYLASLLAGPIGSLVFIVILLIVNIFFASNFRFRQFTFFYSLVTIILNISATLKKGDAWEDCKWRYPTVAFAELIGRDAQQSGHIILTI